MSFRFDRALKFICTLVIAYSIMMATVEGQEYGNKPFSQAQKKEIEILIKRYILNHPDLILESVQRHQIKEENVEKEQAKKQIESLRPQLVSDPDTPVGGNTKGDVTVIEFIDYRCGYCKRAHSTVKKLLKDDNAVRYVIKDFPILGPQSVIASRAALAIWRIYPEKHQAYHNEMMLSRGAIDEKLVVEMANKLGIDKKLLKTKMADKAIDEVLAKNFRLAKALNINGTPAFIIGDEILPGAVDLATLKKIVAKARDN